MRKLLSITLAALCLTACQESLEEKCAKEAKVYTAKNCPSKIDENIIIDSMTFERSTHTLHYYYRMTGIADSVGVLSIEGVKSTLVKDLRNTTAMKAYKDAGYSFAYTYRSDKHPDTSLYDVLIRAEDYK